MAVQLLTLTRASDGVHIEVCMFAIRLIEPRGTGSTVYFLDGYDEFGGWVAVTESPATIHTAANA